MSESFETTVAPDMPGVRDWLARLRLQKGLDAAIEHLIAFSLFVDILHIIHNVTVKEFSQCFIGNNRQDSKEQFQQSERLNYTLISHENKR